MDAPIIAARVVDDEPPPPPPPAPRPVTRAVALLVAGALVLSLSAAVATRALAVQPHALWLRVSTTPAAAALTEPHDRLAPLLLGAPASPPDADEDVAGARNASSERAAPPSTPFAATGPGTRSASHTGTRSRAAVSASPPAAPSTGGGTTHVAEYASSSPTRAAASVSPSRAAATATVSPSRAAASASPTRAAHSASATRTGAPRRAASREPAAPSPASKEDAGAQAQAQQQGEDEEAGEGAARAPVPLTSTLSMSSRSWARFNAKLACWADGRWEYNPAMAATGPRVSDPAGGVPAEEGMRWQWQTHSGEVPVADCTPLPRWARGDFCRVLAGRSVLVLGDSLNRQFHVTLQDLASEIPLSAKRRKALLCKGNGRGKPCRGHTICGGAGGGKPAFLMFRRSDRLHLGVKKFTWTGNFIEEPWQGMMNRFAFDVVVLNRGAHYELDGPFVDQWRRTLAWLREAHPGALVVARNTPPGHKRCGEARQPLARPQDPAGLPFNWGRFGHQNRLLERLVRDEFPGVLLLDWATPTALRPDQHRLGRRGNDCLHYREPRSGAIDHWARLLYAALWLADTMAASDARSPHHHHHHPSRRRWRELPGAAPAGRCLARNASRVV